jgi:hypothetical protein
VLLAEPASRFIVAPEAGQLIDTPLDWRVLLFSLSITTLTASVLCVAPALQMRNMQLADVLKTESGASSSSAQVRLRKTMVVAQLSSCVWLMIAAGLFARSLAQLKAVDLGFRKEQLITFQLDPTMSGCKPARIPPRWRGTRCVARRCRGGEFRLRPADWRCKPGRLSN